MTDTAAQHTASPAFHSGRLKYADPRSLPSFPSPGLRPDGAAASAAATLGWSNQKPVEPWRPGKTADSASTAALLAKDYKMSAAWEPPSNSAGHKAALLAVGSAGAALNHSSSTNQKNSRESWGSSAATQAFQTNRNSTVQPSKSFDGNSAAAQAFHLDRSRSMKKTHSPSNSQSDRSLLAAKGAMSLGSGSRSRSISTPAPAPPSLEASAASSALSGAASAHRASMQVKPPIEDAGAVPVTTMTRNMFTSHPMVKPEVDEQNTNERLHMSAVAMAKKMYSQQQKMLDQAKEAQASGSSEPAQGPQYLNLQDAAYKQAQERLAKLQDEHQKSREYQEYYGNPSSPRRRFSVANKLRRRSSSDGDLEDRTRSEKIRQEMSMFSQKLSEVDKTKRKEDREALLAAAQRNVKARLQGMDEKVYNDTGKVHPAKLSEWEVKAQELAQNRHESRNENRGKLDLGGGFFMDKEEVDAIASKRVQPVLDDINEKAEAERERQAAIRLEQESKKEELERAKARDRERKEINKKMKEEEKQEEKAKKMQLKENERIRREKENNAKAEEKAAKAEQKRLEKEERRKSKQEASRRSAEKKEEERERVAAAAAVGTGAGAITATEMEERRQEDERHDSSDEDARPLAVDTTTEARPPQSPQSPQSPKSTDSPTSPSGKVRGWIKNRFSRGKSFGENDTKRRSFFGGAALKQSGTQESTGSVENRQSSMRDVALAGKSGDEEREGRSAATSGAHDDDAGPSRDSQGVSPVSSDSDEEYQDVMENRAFFTPPKPIEDTPVRKSSSPVRDSRFHEIIDQD